MMFNFLKNESNRWFIGGCLGIVVSTVATVIATKRYELKINEIKEEKGAVTRKDKVKAVTESSVIVGAALGVTGYCFCKARKLNMDTITAWGAAYSVEKIGANAIKAKLKEELGDEKAKEIVDSASKMVSEQYDKIKKTDIKKNGKGLVDQLINQNSTNYLCEDSFSHVQWYSNEDDIEKINKRLIERLFVTREAISLNDIWYEFGILNRMTIQDKVTGSRFGIAPPNANVIDPNKFELFTYTKDTDNMSRMLKLIVNYDVVNIEDWR